MPASPPKNPYILTLDEKQIGELEKLKEILGQRGAYTAPTADKPASPDDLLLLRFLKARRWSAAPAAEQFLSTLEWRKKHGVDKLFREEVVPEEYESWKKTYPKWTGRRDKNGNPLYVYKLSVLTSAVLKDLGKVPEEVRYRRIVALYELLHNLAFPLCLSLPPMPPPPSPPLAALPPLAPLPPHTTRLIQNTTIIDFTSTSLSSMFSFRHHLAQASTLAQANHPETLGSIFVVGAPGWWSTVWGWIRGWFDEQTRAKVHIVPAGSQELLDVIPRESLPRAYGGDMDWVYEDDPVWDADLELLLHECGVPVDPASGLRKLFGPVIVAPRTPDRPVKIELVGKDRYELYQPANAAPTSTAPLAPASAPAPASAQAPLPLANGSAHHPPVEDEAESREGTLTPGTPGFVPDLPGSVLGPAGTGVGEKKGVLEDMPNIEVLTVQD